MEHTRVANVDASYKYSVVVVGGEHKLWCNLRAQKSEIRLIVDLLKVNLFLLLTQQKGFAMVMILGTNDSHATDLECFFSLFKHKHFLVAKFNIFEYVMKHGEFIITVRCQGIGDQRKECGEVPSDREPVIVFLELDPLA